MTPQPQCDTGPRRTGLGLNQDQARSEMSGGRAARGGRSEVTKVEDGLMSVSLGPSLTPETRGQGTDNQIIREKESVSGDWQISELITPGTVIMMEPQVI